MENPNNYPLLNDLLNSGYTLAVLNGRLCIESQLNVSGEKPLSKRQRENIAKEITKLTGYDIFTYQSYTTGNYGVKKSAGLTLQFQSILTGNDAHIIFNANLTRQRSTKNHVKGSPLPSKQFHVGKRSKFYKFWLGAGLKEPESLSKFYKYMGNLKGVLFSLMPDSSGRIRNKEPHLINISFEEITAKLVVPNSPNSALTQPFNSPNLALRNSPNELYSKPQEHLVSEGVESACDVNHDISYQVGECISHTVNPINIEPVNKPIEKETNTKKVTYPDWMLSNPPANTEQFDTVKKRPQEQSVDEWIENYEAANDDFVKWINKYG